MSLINVTSWSGRKLHLAQSEAIRDGNYWPTLCGAASVHHGQMWARSRPYLATQESIDSLPPCKKCAKRREVLERNGGAK